MSVTVYKTIQGDMWDTISYRVFGTGNYMHRLIEANPAIADVWVFGGGVIVVIPQISAEENRSLPPWKRGTGKHFVKQTEDFTSHRYIWAGEEYVSITAENGSVVWADSGIDMLSEGDILTIYGPVTMEAYGGTLVVRRAGSGT